MTTRILKYLILLATGLLIVAISSFWLGGSSFREKDVVLNIEGPTQVSAGDEVTYKLTYGNNTRSTLHNLEFTFFYPEGSTVVDDGKITEGYADNFTIDELAPGEKGEKEFTAFLIGERGNIKIAKANLSFRASNLQSSFEKDSSLSVTIVSSPILLTLAAPPSVNSGQAVEYTLDYRNESDEDATDLILEIDYPDGFTPKEFNPNPNTSNNIWQVKSLKKGNGGRISIEGSLNGREEEHKVISAKLKRKINDKYVDYQRASAVTVISNPILGLEILVNNSSDYSTSLGNRLNYTIRYSNNSNFNLSGMYMTVKLDGEMFDFSTLDTRGGSFDDTNKTITWNSGTISELSRLLPNAKGQITFSIILKSSFSSVISGTSSRDSLVKASAKFGTPNVPAEINSDELAVSGAIVTRIGTQPTFNQFVYYDDQDFDSTGPLPPRVGEETAFTIHWQLTNPGNEIESAKVIAKIPAGVRLSDPIKAEEGQPLPVYNSNSSEITWNVGKLPYGAGIFSGKYEASFQVKIKPSSLQKGSIIPLLENIQFTGTDSFIKQNIVINGSVLNSDNLVDRPREGTVQ